MMSRSTEHDARNAAFLTTFSSCDVSRAQSTPNSIIIPKQAKLLGLVHNVEDVPDSDGAKIHWLGDRSSRKVILYFHGMLSYLLAQTSPWLMPLEEADTVSPHLMDMSFFSISASKSLLRRARRRQLRSWSMVFISIEKQSYGLIDRA